MRKVVKVLGLLGLFATIVLVVAGFRGSSVAASTYESSFRLLSTLPDSIDLEEARRWSVVNGCGACHGDDLGGEVMIDAPPFLVVAPNLTSGAGGVGSGYRSVEDWDRAIRYRIRPDGTGMLPMMPSENYHRMSDEHVALLIASLQAAPPVDRELPETKIRLLGLPIAGLGVLHPAKDQPDAPGAPVPLVEATPEYGAYLSGLMCVECHADDLRGGPTPGGGPKAPDLYASGQWSVEQFAAAVTTGEAPGRQLAAEMPYEFLVELEDIEVRALHAYLASLTPPDDNQ